MLPATGNPTEAFLLDRVVRVQVEASLKIPTIDECGKAFFDINDDGSQDFAVLIIHET